MVESGKDTYVAIVYEVVGEGKVVVGRKEGDAVVGDLRFA